MFFATDLHKSVGFFPADSETQIESIYRMTENDEQSWLEKNISGILKTCEKDSSRGDLSRELLAMKTYQVLKVSQELYRFKMS